MTPERTAQGRDDQEQVRRDVAALRAPQPVAAEELGARISQIQAIAELGEIAAHAEDPDALLRVAVDLVARGNDAASAAYFEAAGAGRLRTRAATRRERVGEELDAGGMLALRVLESGTAMVASGGGATGRAPGSDCACAPVSGGGQPLGVLCAWARDGRRFDAADLQFVQIAANVVGGWLGRHGALAEMREMQARLALADRIFASATVAAGLAHEINNPLAVVTSNLAWVAEALRELPRGAAAPDAMRAEVHEALADARRSADRIRDLIRDLRALNRGDERDLAAVPVAPLVNACARIASAELAGRARLVVDVDGVPPVHGNEARLGQVFLNLLVNAANAVPLGTPERHEVRVTARDLGAFVEIEIRDTGRGIAPERLERLFEPFYASGSSSGGTTGRGLGLPICHRIVTSIGGSIEVESTPGVGSAFRVLLRVAPSDAPPGHLSATRR